MKLATRFLTGLLVVAVVGGPQIAARAEETAGSAGSGTPADATLKGSVVQIDVTLNTLRDARLSTSRVRKAAANLYDEVTRQEVTMGFSPNVVGTTIITVPTPTFTGQYLPARRKWVKESMNEIGPIMNLFKEDVDDAIENDRRTDVGDSARKELDPIKEQVFALVKQSFGTYKELETLTGGSSYDNGTIATAAKSLDNEMKQLDRSLKKGMSILQKEAKASKKAASKKK